IRHGRKNALHHFQARLIAARQYVAHNGTCDTYGIRKLCGSQLPNLKQHPNTLNHVICLKLQM
ncbi:MAG TPA: hypothetical protein VF630_05060, partial [Hymenobacter sp.]